MSSHNQHSSMQTTGDGRQANFETALRIATVMAEANERLFKIQRGGAGQPEPFQEFGAQSGLIRPANRATYESQAAHGGHELVDPLSQQHQPGFWYGFPGRSPELENRTAYGNSQK